MNHSKRHGEILKLLQEEGTITIGKTTIPVADTHKTNLNKRLNLL